jgi:hypothetical protein
MALFTDLLVTFVICYLTYLKIRKAGCYGVSVPVGFQHIKWF